jgi:hypothetical protein
MLSGFVLVVFSIPLLAAPRKPDSKQSFTSPNGTFKFQHSSLLLECKQSPKQAGRWMPDSCEAYSSVCDDSDPKVTTIACFAYPKTKYKDFPSFEAAAFSVAEITAATTRNVCLSGSPDWVIDPRGSGRTVAINGVNFKKFEIDGVGAGNILDGYVYRSFHRNKCYELGIRLAWSNPANYDPGTIKRFTEADWEEVYGRLQRALQSFQFLK